MTPCFRPVTVQSKEHRLLLRLLNKNDTRRLQSFFYSHTQETIHSRYGYMIRDMTPERAHSLVSVDQTRDLAIALTQKVKHQEHIRAVGRYYLNKDLVSAEIAVVVCEQMRHQGLGRLLVQTMIREATHRGLRLLEAWVLSENKAMILLLKKLHFMPQTMPQAGMLRMALDLSRQAASKAKS